MIKLDHRWKRIGIFIIAWVCAAIAGYYESDPSRNDEGAGIVLALGVINLPIGILIYWFVDGLINKLREKKPIRSILAIILLATILNIGLAVSEILILRPHH